MKGANDLLGGVKRVVDVVGAVALGTALLPAIAGAAAVVRIKIGRPILFQQNRLGLHGYEFTLYKLRSMTNSLNPSGEPLPDGERLTSLGERLRRWSLDELPELWNVLIGDMSLVGPRPLLAEYLDLYTEDQMRRHEMRPGLTGLAQVSGRNNQTWEDRLALGVWYVDHWSIWIDARIIARTVVAMLRREGITTSEHVTMPRFQGSPFSRRPSESDQRGSS